jgi:hypothetical protein
MQREIILNYTFFLSFCSFYEAPEMLDDILTVWTPAAYYVVAMSVGKWRL